MARSAIQLQISKLLQIGLALVASVILARGLGPTGFGGYAVLISFAVLLQGVTSFGFEDLVLARGPLYGSDTHKARALYGRVLRIRGGAIILLSVGGAGALTGVIPDPFPATSAVAFGCALLYAASNSLATLGAVVQAARVQPTRSAMLDTLWSLGVTATYGVLASVGDLTLSAAVLVSVVWQFAVGLGYLALLLPFVAHTDADVEAVDPFRPRESAMFWVNGLLSIGIGKNSDVLAMQIAGARHASIGLYNSAYNANLTASQSLLQGAGTMLYVRMGSVFAAGTSESIAAVWRSTTVLTSLFAVPFLVYCALFPREVLVAIYGAPYAPAAPALVALALTSVLGRGLGGGGNQSMLFLAHRQLQVLTVRTSCVALNIALDIVVYHPFGIVGVALVSGGCSTAIVAIEFVLSRRIAPLRIPAGQVARLTMPYCVIGGIVNLTLGDNGGRLSLVTGASLVLGAGTMLLGLTRPLDSDDVPDSAPALIVRLMYLIARPRLRA